MRIIESNNIIKLKIFKELADNVNKSLTKYRNNILNDVKTLVKLKLTSSETYRSLISGELEKSFGFPAGDSQYYVDSIIDIAAELVSLRQTKLTHSHKGVSGGISVNLYKGSSALLLHSESVIKYEEYNIPWVKWLLTEGDTIIISGFSIIFEEGLGRSGGAIMIKNTGGVWRVPPEFSGTDNDNWITRTMTSSEFQYGIESIIRKYIT